MNDIRELLRIAALVIVLFLIMRYLFKPIHSTPSPIMFLFAPFIFIWRIIKLLFFIAFVFIILGILFCPTRLYDFKLFPEKPVDAKEQTYSLLSANIGNLSPQNKYTLRDKDIAVIKSNIQRLSPDIILFQEIESCESQLPALIDRSIYLTCCSKGSAIGVNSSKFQSITLVSEQDGRLTCQAYAKEGDPVFLNNVHFASLLSDMDFSQRHAQLTALFKFIKTNAQSRNIYTGDFNFDPYRSGEFKMFIGKDYDNKHEKAVRQWSSIFFTDKETDHQIISTNVTTWVVMNGPDGPLNSFALDHVITNFGKGSCTVLKSIDDRIDMYHGNEVRSGNVGFMDHRALLCQIDILSRNKVRRQTNR